MGVSGIARGTSGAAVSPTIFGPISFKAALVISLLHVVIVAGIVSSVRSFLGDPLTINDMLQFDAVHYRDISIDGYAGFRMAFFPFFPMIWKVTGLGILGISALNTMIFLSSAVFLARTLRISNITYIIWLVVPSALFYYLPFSEATFFLSATVLLLGLHKNSIATVSLGLLCCSMARPAFTVLVPAMILVSIYRHNMTLRALKEGMVYLVASLVGLSLVALVQHNDTGEWLGFYAQQAGWGNYLRFPSFPLTSWGGAAPTRLDAVAFLFGSVSTCYLISTIWKRYRHGHLEDPLVILSLAYSAGISFLVLMYRGGELFSLNRFVFATPFALVLIYKFMVSGFQANMKRSLVFFTIMLAFFLLFGSYVHIRTFTAYALISAYLVLFLWLPKLHRERSSTTWSWILITLGLQVFFILHYLSGGWVA